MGRKLKCLNKAIHTIMTFVRIRLINRLIISRKGKVTSRIADLWKCHKTSLTLDTKDVIKHYNYWQVLSPSYVKEMYEICSLFFLISYF
mgnify:CR=1 FL=1